MQDPNDPDNSNEPEYYMEEHELGHTPRSMDEVEPDRYLDSNFEDRNEIGGGYEF